MDRIKCLLTIFLCCFSLITYAANLATSSPIGYWKSIDSETGRTKTIIQIWKTDDEKLQGRVIQTFSGNERQLGQTILSGLSARENQWNGGHLYDLENGKKYQCSLRMAENGKKLNVRGYVGIPILGRSQTWERVDLMSDIK